jgi:diamine N-acetyltransferase
LEEKSMNIILENFRQIILRSVIPEDLDDLYGYFSRLSSGTLRRFGPHPFDRKSLSDIYESQGNMLGYIALEAVTSEIIAYTVVKPGYLEHDCPRLRSYGLTLDKLTDCTLAPSVADAWQGKGVGSSLFDFILADLKKRGLKRVILWGGVQSDNLAAVGFYRKKGFRELGQFEYQGWNLDMILDVSDITGTP